MSTFQNPAATEEWRQALNHFIEREADTEDALPGADFFAALAAIEAQRTPKVVELSGKIVGEEVVFDAPAPLPVEKNVIDLGDLRIVLKLRVERVAPALA